MTQLEASGAFLPFDRRINPEPLGYPLTAFIRCRCGRRSWRRSCEQIAEIPEVLQAHGMSGAST